MELSFKPLPSKKNKNIYFSISLPNIPSWLRCLHHLVLSHLLFEPSSDWRKTNKS